MKEVFGKITLFNADCMDVMREMPDKAFDLAIVDPPYGVQASKQGSGARKNIYDRTKKWDEQIPSLHYFKELSRVSKNTIIWGMNYFPQLFPIKNFIVWDKIQPAGVTFAQAEIASTTFPGTSKIYRGVPNGQKPRIHPTQKPIELYQWLLARYSQPGYRILDTHLGSGSSAIACDMAGLECTGIEIDADYYAGARQRLINHRLQQRLF